MPILYEPTVLEVKQLRRKYRPKALQVEEAPRWRVVEEYGVSSIYMTPDDLKKRIRDELAKACTQKGATLEYFEVLEMRAVWKVFYTEYYCKYKALIKGSSPLAHLIVILILAICLTALLIFLVWLVKTYIIEPIFEAVPPELKPALGAAIVALLFGGSIFIGGLGYWYIKRRK